MKVRLVALDIDGTLLAPGTPYGELPQSDIVEAVAQLRGSGIHVVLASGRMFPGTRDVAKHLGLDGPLVCVQGAATHMPDGTLVRQLTVDLTIAHELVRYARSISRPYAWFDANRYFASEPNPASFEFGLASAIEPGYRPDPENADLQPIGVDIISEPGHAQDIHATLSTKYGDQLHLLDFPTVTVATDPRATKARALADIARDLGIGRESIVALGDSVNDASMLTWAARGVAMPHADRHARAAADEVLGGHGIEGVAPLLRSLLD